MFVFFSSDVTEINLKFQLLMTAAPDGSKKSL
jgi:hypothetical protein